MAERKAIRVSTAAKSLDVTPQTVKRWIERQYLEGFKMPSGQWRVYADSVAKMRETTAPPDMHSSPY